MKCSEHGVQRSTCAGWRHEGIRGEFEQVAEVLLRIEDKLDRLGRLAYGDGWDRLGRLDAPSS